MPKPRALTLAQPNATSSAACGLLSTFLRVDASGRMSAATPGWGLGGRHLDRPQEKSAG